MAQRNVLKMFPNQGLIHEGLKKLTCKIYATGSFAFQLVATSWTGD